MNDEDFARQFFARALDGAGEPGALPDIDRITAAGRKAARNRQGLYAAGSVALAGAVTAGVVTAPSLLDIGGNGGSTLTTTGSPSSSRPVASQGMTKPPGVACSQPPQIDWTALVRPHLPTGASMTPLHEPTCVQPATGATAVEALYTLSHPDGILQIDVNTGLPAAKASLRATAESTPLAAGSGDQGLAQKLAALRSAGDTLPSTEPPLGASTKTAQPPQCTDVGTGETACVADLSKGGFRSIDVQLFRTASPDTIVDVTATAPEPTTANPSPAIPLDQNELIAIAQAVAAHF